MSEAMLSGFTTAAAVHVFSSQVKHVFGVSVPGSTGVLKLVKVQKFHFHGHEHMAVYIQALSTFIHSYGTLIENIFHCSTTVDFLQG